MNGLSTTPIESASIGAVNSKPKPSEATNLEHIKEPVTKTFKYKKHLKTFIACFSAALGAIGLGTVVSYSSPSTPDLNQHRNPFHLSTAGVSWAASIDCITGMCGAVLGGLFLDKYGRTFVMALTSLSLTIGWVVIAASNNVPWFLVGRLISGFATGFADVAVPAYITEIAHPSARGFLGSCHGMGTNIGYLFVFIMGCLLHWNWIAIACMVFPVLLAVSLLFIPESPRWLLSQGRRQQCMEILQHLREQDDVTAELLEIEEILQNSSSNVHWKDLKKSNLCKPLLVIIGLMFFQQWSGYCALLSYTVEILDSTQTTWNANWISAGYGFVGTLSNFISAVVVDRAGRRVMLMISSGIMIISMAGLSSFFTVKYFCLNFDISILSWLPMVSLMTFNFGMAIGYGPIPFYLASELFPLRSRGIAGGIVTCSMHLFAFTSVFVFPYLQANLENYVLYWIVTLIAFCGMVFAFLVVPETKGKSLEEIEMEFRK